MLFFIISVINKDLFTAVICFALSMYDFVTCRHDYKHRDDKQTVAPDIIVENIDDELKKLIMKGEDIEAIRIYKTAKGIGLIEAKQYVDALKESLLEEGDHTFRL